MRDLVVAFLRAVGFRRPSEWSGGALAVALKKIAEVVRTANTNDNSPSIPVGTVVLVNDNTKATPWTGTVTQILSPYVVEVTDTGGEAWDVFVTDCKALAQVTS